MSREGVANLRYQPRLPDDVFFGIVRRDGAMIMLKDVGVDPLPNYKRDVKKGVARWDAYLYVPDPDALAAEFASRNVEYRCLFSTRRSSVAQGWMANKFGITVAMELTYPEEEEEIAGRR